jgi:hypothetical protein
MSKEDNLFPYSIQRFKPYVPHICLKCLKRSAIDKKLVMSVVRDKLLLLILIYSNNVKGGHVTGQCSVERCLAFRNAT